ncbi:permease [Gordonia paraffinivorans]|uniref:purine-cytosine permease family protein n=1 Tax=Gordonia paraffinivorans TaxID=175628 RepID=UPI000D61FDD2|nr:cytosine permease [Gordonia paraffinivorans]PWD43192.1 permease [Gordonia paraffinivorans]
MPALPASPPTERSGPEGSDANFSAAPVPESMRLGRWQVTMSYWSLLSAMVWLFYGALAASLYGTVNAIIAVVVSTVLYGAVSIFMTRIGIRYGLNTTMLTKAIFGKWGATLTALLVAATVLYYAIFESSTLAVAFQVYFEAGDIRIWYAVVVLGMLPLMLGRVQDWMAKLNGVLLPFYFIGLVIVIVAAAVKFDANSWTSFEGIVPDEGRALPGWLLGVVLYLGILITMPTTVDFARFAKKEDERFHENVTFGWVFYAVLFIINGIAGIFLVQVALPNEPASEIGVVQAVLMSAGLFGLLFIVISQTRVNTLNYYQSTTNFERILSAYSKIRLPHAAWVVAVAVVVFLLMLTDVFSYVQTALNWQGVFVVGWVGVVVTHFALNARDRAFGPKVDDGRLPKLGWGLIAWIVPSIVGVILLESSTVPAIWNQSAQLVVLFSSVILYAIGHFVASDRVDDDRPSVEAGV